MPRAVPARQTLYEMTRMWAETVRWAHEDQYTYVSILDEVLFHADLRFSDYIQFANEGPFPERLKKWLENVTSNRERQSLFKLLPWVLFVDRLQMISLYRDAYRRVLVPWVSGPTLSGEDMLAPDYEHKVRSLLRRYRLFSITLSFDNPGFLHVNNLAGLYRPEVLGENRKLAPAKLPAFEEGIDGIIIFEDFVGSGNQARGVLLEVQRHVPERCRMLFVPLIILEKGLTTLRSEQALTGFTIEPVVVIAKKYCLQRRGVAGEPVEFGRVRPVIEGKAKKVLEKYGEFDDPPRSPYGYGECGALIVTCHNVPNNTLPLIHHRAPEWFPLFRRVHASKDGVR